MPSIIKSLFIFIIICSTIISDTPLSIAATLKTDSNTTSGYSALKLFLDDEQYLTMIRRAKMIITFSAISEKSSDLIDNIADTSKQSLDELETLLTQKPTVIITEFADDSIAKATLDSLRMTAAKELFFEPKEFEKNLLLGQIKILRVISHLAKQLEEKEVNAKRKLWLKSLAERYEAYYQQVNARISIS